MGKDFAIYSLLCLIVLFFGFQFSNTFLIVLFNFLVFAAIVLRILINIDSKNIKLNLRIDHNCVQYEGSYFEISLTSPKELTAAGLIYFTFEITFDKYGEKRIRSLKIPASKKQGSIKIPFVSDNCSSVTIKCQSFELNDILGITKVKLKAPKPIIFTVFPKELPISITSNEHLFFTAESDQIMQDKKGTDMSEIFELREYVPGDNIKAIHWKLSNKIDKPIVRVGHSSTNTKTLIFLDIGRESGNNAIEGVKLSNAVSLAFTISHRLLDMGIGHKICSTDAHSISYYEINDLHDIIYAQKHILSSPLPKENGIGISHLLSSYKYTDFSKIIYVYSQNYTQNLLRLSLLTDVVALNISDESDEIEVSMDNKCRFYSLPQSKLEKETFNINL